MAFLEEALESGRQIVYSGYVDIGDQRSLNITYASSNDIWATGSNLIATVYSGGDVVESITGGVDCTIYNPYKINAYISGNDFHMEYYTWPVYCSGFVDELMISSMDNADISDLTESGVRALLYRFVGSVYTYHIGKVRGNQTYITWSGF